MVQEHARVRWDCGVFLGRQHQRQDDGRVSQTSRSGVPRNHVAECRVGTVEGVGRDRGHGRRAGDAPEVELVDDARNTRHVVVDGVQAKQVKRLRTARAISKHNVVFVCRGDDSWGKHSESRKAVEVDALALHGMGATRVAAHLQLAARRVGRDLDKGI